MDKDPPPKPANPAKSRRETPREDRLKAALKANMARRKAQVRARADVDRIANENGHKTENDNKNQ